MSEINGSNGKRTCEGHSNRNRATQAEKEERIVETQKMVIQGRSKAAVKQYLCGKYGIVWQTALRYLRVARERLRDENNLNEEFTLEDMKVQHYAMAMKIASNRKESTRVRLAALKHAGEIYGILAPSATVALQPAVEKPHEPTWPQTIEFSDEELRVMKKFRDRIREIQTGATQPLAIC